MTWRCWLMRDSRFEPGPSSWWTETGVVKWFRSPTYGSSAHIHGCLGCVYCGHNTNSEPDVTLDFTRTPQCRGEQTGPSDVGPWTHVMPLVNVKETSTWSTSEDQDVVSQVRCKLKHRDHDCRSISQQVRVMKSEAVRVMRVWDMTLTSAAPPPDRTLWEGNWRSQPGPGHHGPSRESD